MSHIRSRLIGLLGTVALVAFVVGVPALLIAIGATRALGDFSWSALMSRDDGTLAVAVIGVVAWVAWAVFAVSVVVEVAARVRGLPAPRVPGFALPQVAAGQLVGVAGLLFVAVPAISAAAPVPHAAALPLRAPEPLAQSAPVAAMPVIAPVAATAPSHRPDTEAYTVKRGDSLWKIAKDRLGDGTRYVELAELNRGVLDGEPNFLLPGTVLRVPVATAPADHSTYVVEPGDTLSEIADEELGDAHAYPEIFQASRSTVQPDGGRLTDPNLIRPGWRLTLTPNQAGGRDETPKHRDHIPQAEPEITQTPAAVPDSPHADGAGVASVAAPNGEDLPAWVLPGLAGGGAVLAGSLLLTLRQHRRTQLRYRRPGHVIDPPPRDLTPAEKSIQASGSITAPRVEILDRALRELGESAPGARVMTATLSRAEVAVILAEPTELPSPWSGTGASWRIAHGDVPTDRRGCVAPFPLLVSIGIDPDGAVVLINLEEMHAATISGAPDRAAALGRHIAAELALNPWSALVEVDTVGIGEELADIDPSRLHHHAADDTAFLDQLASDLESEDPTLEPDQFRTLITTGDVDSVQKVAEIITGYQGRAGAAVLAFSADEVVGDVVLNVDAGGELTVETHGLRLTAAGLSVDEARACATLVDITRDTTVSPMPADKASEVADAAGALKDELVEPRPPEGPAGERSLLPQETHVYVTQAATVTEDVQRLAPVVTPETERHVVEADPQLDEDVARWQASRLMGPKLTLLGPVSARTLGDTRKMAHRRPFYVELLAFLALHPKGVTANEIGEAFGLQPERARKDVGIIRGWLGSDPRTGKPHLPNARQAHADGVQGRYVVRGVATDLDLFRRLRARGESRGAAGIEDLTTALALVSGEPFTDLRPAGWSWLLEGERLDHIMTCAIVDTAHIVTTHALSVGDLDLARFAAETAADAAPYEEIPQLDQAAVDAAAGDDDRATERVIDGVLNRTDDELGPVEVPERSGQVMSSRGWNQQRARSAG